MTATEAAKEARRAYKRQWARDNPDKVKLYNQRYWAKKAQQAEPAQRAEPEPKQED